MVSAGPWVWGTGMWHRDGHGMDTVQVLPATPTPQHEAVAPGRDPQPRVLTAGSQQQGPAGARPYFAHPVLGPVHVAHGWSRAWAQRQLLAGGCSASPPTYHGGPGQRLQPQNSHGVPLTLPKHPFLRREKRLIPAGMFVSKLHHCDLRFGLVGVANALPIFATLPRPWGPTQAVGLGGSVDPPTPMRAGLPQPRPSFTGCRRVPSAPPGAVPHPFPTTMAVVLMSEPEP